MATKKKKSSRFRGQQRVRRWSVDSAESDVSCGCGCGGEPTQLANWQNGEAGRPFDNGNKRMVMLPCGKMVLK